jgi:hypothetical protein
MLVLELLRLSYYFGAVIVRLFMINYSDKLFHAIGAAKGDVRIFDTTTTSVHCTLYYVCPQNNVYAIYQKELL